MTEDRLPLAELLRKAGEGDFLRAVAEAVLRLLLLEADVEGLIGAGRHGRSPERLNWRNGYRERAFDTRLGTLQLRVPKLRQGSYFPRSWSQGRRARRRSSPWSRRRGSAACPRAGSPGSSRRRACPASPRAPSRSSARTSTSASRASWNGRPLEGEWRYLWLDATYLKGRSARAAGRIVSVAAMIAVAVDTEGRREIVGLGLGPSEAEPFCSAFLKGLVRRGLKGVKPVISDAHEGGSSMRPPRSWAPPLAALPRALDEERARPRPEGPADGGRRGSTPSLPASRPGRGTPGLAAQVADQLRPRWPRLAALMDESEADVLAYMAFPAQHRAKLHSTNPLERLDKEVKRRADDVVGIFPGEPSITRLIGAVPLEANDEWQLQHRYMQVEGMAELLAPDPEALRLPPLAA